MASRGICCFEVTIKGRQGHSGLSELLPPSATVAAARAITALAALAPSHPEIPGSTPDPTVNAGVLVEGGVFYGVHPGEARVGCEVRTVHGMDRDTLEARRARRSRTRCRPSSSGTCASATTGSAGCRRPWRCPATRWWRRRCAPARRARPAPPLAAYPAGTDATAFSLVRDCRASPAWAPASSRAPTDRRARAAPGLREAVDLYDRRSRTYIDRCSLALDTGRRLKWTRSGHRQQPAQRRGEGARQGHHRARRAGGRARGPVAARGGDRRRPPKATAHRLLASLTGASWCGRWATGLRPRQPLPRPRRGLPGRDRPALGSARRHAAAGRRRPARRATSASSAATTSSTSRSSTARTRSACTRASAPRTRPRRRASARRSSRSPPRTSWTGVRRRHPVADHPHGHRPGGGEAPAR